MQFSHITEYRQYSSDWQEEYKRRLVTAEEAAKVVKSGDRVALPFAHPTQVPEVSLVTMPRQFADYVVTEYGIASLAGKSHRERANELVAIAHPDHRADLRKAAKEMFYP